MSVTWLVCHAAEKTAPLAAAAKGYFYVSP